MGDRYTGYKYITMNEEELANFYSNPEGDYGVQENEYLVIKNEEGVVVDKQCYQNGEFRPLHYRTVKSTHAGDFKSKNLQQDLAFDMLQDSRTPIKILTGRFGSGKSLLMIAHALEAVERNKVDKIIYVRNNIELKHTTPLGALPGTLEDKMIEWAANIGDHVGGMEGLRMLIDRGNFEIAPLGYLRGRDFKRSIIFCDECENLTTAQVQLLIGRIGENSQLWMAGDWRQTDKKVFDDDSGLNKAIDRLQGKPLFAYVHLEKSERSEASAYADYLDN